MRSSNDIATESPLVARTGRSGCSCPGQVHSGCKPFFANSAGAPVAGNTALEHVVGQRRRASRVLRQDQRMSPAKRGLV